MTQNWLLCFQTPYDSIKYVTNEMSYPNYLPYYKFLDYIINTIHIHNFEGFQNQLDKFFTILINIDTHEWEVYNEERKEAGFYELFDLNEKRKEEELKSKDKNNSYGLNEKKEFIRGITKKDLGSRHDFLRTHRDFSKGKGKG